MGKKHKHEEHVNHERWLVSFADMMTLLFALFVVLYALGSVELEKLRDLKKSVQFAFHIEGEGKTKDTGMFDKQAGGGDVIEAAPLITAQDGEMREFLKDELEKYEEVTGKSLRIVQTDDTISFTAPMSDFFEPLQPYPLKREVAGWLDRVLTASLTFASRIQIIVEMPDLLIGRSSRGVARTSVDLSILRLQTLERFVLSKPEVTGEMVASQWQRQAEMAGRDATRWESDAKVSIAFTNPSGQQGK
ncbi:MAG: hypothetical protein NXI31_08090 [bacterium]|nr:hypothetical protein [bacterium]